MSQLGLTLAPVLTALVVIAVSPGYATDLRGRVDGRTQFSPSPFPMRGAEVGIWTYHPQLGWRPIATSHTGLDGMYYFRGIPPGRYSLIVNRSPAATYDLIVQPSANQDIPPVLFPF